MSDSFYTFDPSRVRRSNEAGVVPKTSEATLKQVLEQSSDIAVVDVRDPADFAKGHIPGAVNMPPNEWPAAPGVSKDQVVVVYSYNHTCPLGGAACAELAGRGYPVVEMDGGFDVWQTSDLMPDS